MKDGGQREHEGGEKLSERERPPDLRIYLATIYLSKCRIAESFTSFAGIDFDCEGNGQSRY